MTVEAWYDRSHKIWIAVYRDSAGDQVGNCGYGNSKKDAVDDLKYQREISGD